MDILNRTLNLQEVLEGLAQRLGKVFFFLLFFPPARHIYVLQ